MTVTFATDCPVRDSVGTTVEYFGEVMAGLEAERLHWLVLASHAKQPEAADAMRDIAERVARLQEWTLLNLAVHPKADYFDMVRLPIPEHGAAADDLFTAVSRRADYHFVDRNDMGMSKALSTLADLISERTAGDIAWDDPNLGPDPLHDAAGRCLTDQCPDERH